MTVPNLITTLRIILAPIFIIYLINDQFLSALIVFLLCGISDGLEPRGTLPVRAVDVEGTVKEFVVDVRLDSRVEVEYYQNGGILHTVLRRMASGQM